MWVKAKQVRLAFAVLGLALAGCGGNGTTALPATVTDPGVQSEAVVYIYFCTADTCAKEVTQAQINAVSRRASDSPLVEKVVFISKEEALAILRRKYPEEVKALPSNPFPDRLTVVPKHQEDVKQSRPSLAPTRHTASTGSTTAGSRSRPSSSSSGRNP